ncbi:hypothetical protein ABK040_007369 [Willaertia magna]
MSNDNIGGLVRKVESFDRTIYIDQDLGIVNKEAGAMVWDSALVLAKYFENTRVFPEGFFKGKKVLELGTGTGIIGIVLLTQGAIVHFTDKKELIPLIEKNIFLNCTTSGELPKVDIDKDQYKVFEYLWGEPNEIVDNTEYDFIIGCDVIYESKEMWLPLAKALNEQLNNTKGQVIIAHEKRSQKDLSFFPFIQETYKVEQVPKEWLDPFWQCDAIRVFYLHYLGNKKENTTIDKTTEDFSTTQ